MTRPLTLPTAPPEHRAMDYAFLRAEGIRHIQRMAGAASWTDYNAHDPGITILEQLCYAITDLGYRIAYDLPDLLAGDGGDPSESLYTPAEILTSHPVTLTDLRKVVLDVPGVKNAWIEPVRPESELRYHEGKRELRLEGDSRAAEPTTEPVYLKGLYRVLIEKSDLDDIVGTVVQREVRHRLHANRSLCEDFEEVRVLETQDIQIDARIEIGPVDDAEEVLLQIFHRISDHISPRVPFQSLGQLLAAGKPVEEIFDGPPLQHGFIDSDLLRQASRKTAIHTSDLIHEIMAVPGVRAVSRIGVWGGSTSPDPESGESVKDWEAWSLNLDPNSVPKLDLEGSEITLEKGRLEVSLDVAAVIDAYWKRLRSMTTFRPLPVESRDLVLPRGRDRDVARYYSIQHQFPALYGIGEVGLADSATPERKAQSKQLKAYLLFFDQLLANCFAQLGRAKELFSFSGDGRQTYFSQMIEDPALGLEDIRSSDTETHRNVLADITDNPGRDPGVAPTGESRVSWRRKNRFLNHLTARFAEEFTDYSLILFDLMAEREMSTGEKMARDKQAFLQNYPRISSARGAAFNLLLPWGPDNRSGLEDRIRYKLGLSEADGEDFFLIEHILLRPMAGDEPGVPLLSNVSARDPYSLRLTFVFPPWPARFKKPAFRRFVERTVREETPAHLTPYVRWPGKAAMEQFVHAHRDWLEKRRQYAT